MLCGESFAGSTDTNDLVVGCADGMLYSLGNAYGDTTTSGQVTPTAVQLYVKTREYLGQFYELQATRFGATFSCADAMVNPVFGVYGDNPLTQAWRQGYYFPGGETKITPPTKVSNSVVRGRSLYMDLTVSTVNPFVLQKIELTAGSGRRV